MPNPIKLSGDAFAQYHFASRGRGAPPPKGTPLEVTSAGKSFVFTQFFGDDFPIVKDIVTKLSRVSIAEFGENACRDAGVEVSASFARPEVSEAPYWMGIKINAGSGDLAVFVPFNAQAGVGIWPPIVLAEEGVDASSVLATLDKLNDGLTDQVINNYTAQTLNARRNAELQRAGSSFERK